jgi:hypothetical protein
MIGIAAAREGFNRRDITNVCLIRSEHKIADSMTKLTSNSALHRLLLTHHVNHPIEQFVLEPLSKPAYMNPDLCETPAMNSNGHQRLHVAKPSHSIHSCTSPLRRETSTSTSLSTVAFDLTFITARSAPSTTNIHQKYQHLR